MPVDIKNQKMILAKCLRNKEFAKVVTDYADDKAFTTRSLQWIFDIIKSNIINDYGLPKLNTFKVRANRLLSLRRIDDKEKSLRLSLAKSLYRISTFSSTKEAKTELISFLEEQNYVKTLRESIRIQEETGDVSQAKDLIYKGFDRKYSKKKYIISDYLSEWSARQRHREYERTHPDESLVVPTGLQSLDAVIGGVRAGELFTVVGTTGKGKSIFLIHIVYYALLYGFDVLFITLENSLRQIEQRLDSRITRIMYDNLTKVDYSPKEQRTADIWFKKIYKELKRKLFTVYINPEDCKVHDIRNIFRDALQRGLNKNKCMIVLDYLDEVKPSYAYQQNWIEQGALYQSYKNFLLENNIPSWTATQAKAEFQDKIAYANALAKSYDKARRCDGIVSFNQLESEKDTKEALLYVVKMRDSRDGFGIPLFVDKAYMLIKEDKRKKEIAKEKTEIPPTIEED